MCDFDLAKRFYYRYFKDVIALSFFFLIAILYFNKALSGEQIFTERDLAPFFIPPKLLWVDMIKLGQLPLWNPYNYAGLPLFAALQPGVLYPPHILYLILPFNIAWNWTIILHFILAASTVYYFLRHIGASHMGSFIGGIIFMLSGYMLSIHNLLTHLFSVAWLPLVLVFYLKYLDSMRKRFLVLASIFMTIEFLGGAPEIVLATVFILFVITLFQRSFTNRQLILRSRMISFVMCIMLFLLLSSIQLIPFVEMIQQSIRKGGLSYKEAITWSFAFRDLIQLFLPDFYAYSKTIEGYWGNQSWLKTIYLGIAPFVLTAFYFTSKDKKRWIFLFLIGVSFLCALGGSTPLYKVLYKIPPFSSIRYPVKFLFLFFLVMSVISGLGLDVLRVGIERKEKIIKLMIQVILYVGFVFAVLWGFLNIFETNISLFLDIKGIKPDAYNEIWFNIHNAKRFFFFALLFCIAVFFYFRYRQKTVFLLVLVAIITADLFLANYGFYHASPWEKFIAKNDFIEKIPNDKDKARYLVTVKTEKDFDQYLFAKNVAGPAYCSIYGKYSVQGSEVIRGMYLEFYLRLLFCGSSIIDAHKLIDIAGIRYVCISYPVNSEDYHLLHSTRFGDKTAYLYQNQRYNGRFSFYGRVHKVSDDTQMMQKLTDKKIDLRKELIIIDKESTGEDMVRDVRGKLTLISYLPRQVVFSTELENTAFLYLSDTYYPGWRAYVDGKETKIYRANLAFRAIEVPKGRHTVVFRYVPMSFYIGLVLTLFGIALCVWLWRRDRRTLLVSEDEKERNVPDDKGGGT